MTKFTDISDIFLEILSITIKVVHDCVSISGTFESLCYENPMVAHSSMILHPDDVVFSEWLHLQWNAVDAVYINFDDEVASVDILEKNVGS